VRISIFPVQEAWLVPSILDECLIPSDVVPKRIGTCLVDLVKVNGGDVGSVDYTICLAHVGTLDE
jgi:hypothetical protein